MAIYDDAVATAKTYMGPAAGKFIDKQIKSVGADPSSVGAQHIDALATACFNAGKMLIGDDKAQEFSNKIKALK